MLRAGRFIAFGGAVGLLAGWGVLHARVLAAEPYGPLTTSRFGWTLLFTAALMVALYATGLPELPTSRRGALASAAVAVGASAGLVSMAQLLAGQPLLPRSVVLGSSATILPLQVIAWNLAVDGRRRSQTRARVLLLADRESVAEVAEDLDGSVEQPAVVVASLDPAELAADPGGASPVTDLLHRTSANLVVLDVVAQAIPSVVAEVAELHGRGVRVRTLSLFTEQFLGKLPLGELERVSLLFDIGELHRLRYNRAKRAVELIITASLLPAVALVALALLAVNRFGNPGPLLYRQLRIGKGGRPFTMVKFRTMHGGDPAPPTWTTAADPRITPLGRILRRSHLDELPQVLNVVRGDLSLIGPRPEQPHYVEQLREKVPFYDVRHLVRPGLTGWAQVKYPYGADEQDAMEKLQYDFYYLRRQSLVLDGRILVRTIRQVLWGAGR